DRRFLGHLFSPRSFLSLPVHSTIGGGGHTLPRSLSAPPCTRCTWQNMIQHCLSGALKSVFRTKRNALKRLSCFCFMPRASHLSFCLRLTSASAGRKRHGMCRFSVMRLSQSLFISSISYQR